MPRAEPWRYEKLTWPEINEAVLAKKVVLVPIGSTEQHGPHLPFLTAAS
jgi:creatinine amidohydrolase